MPLDYKIVRLIKVGLADNVIKSARNMSLRNLMALSFVCASLATPAHAGFEEGLIAYRLGDYSQALHEWAPIAAQGNAEAQKNLGSIYRQGRGVPVDFFKAIEWYKKAAKQGNATAQYTLGQMYFEAQGVPQDFAKAAKWYRKAAEQGLNAAGYSLGEMYYNGLGVQRDFAAANEWWNIRQKSK